MAKINVLTSDIYNKIAAGEVVERPASVVKELLDNSLDAGATDISVEILGGGIDKITIKDNGSGIAPDSAFLAFQRYATSKISSESDLYNIQTLGFRGEALSSIAAVSRVTLRTKTADCDNALEITIAAGVPGQLTHCAHNNGTTIIVEDLFYNTPARKKFLKTPRAEAGEISGIISRYILANPQVRFLLRSDNKLVYQSYGNGLLDAVCSVYGQDVAKNLIEINHQNQGFKLSGYIGKSRYSKPNRTYQTLAINGRYVINSTVNAAVTNAYSQFLMKRQYPFYVLHLSLPAGFVDVNVHPNKMDVRFEDNKKVFSTFYHPIMRALEADSQKLTDNFVSANLKTNTFGDLAPKLGESTVFGSNTTERAEHNANITKSFKQKNPDDNSADSLAEIKGESYADSVLRRYDPINQPYEYPGENLKVSDFLIPDFYGVSSSHTSQTDSAIGQVSAPEASLVRQDISSNDMIQQKQQLGLSGLVIHGTLFNTYITAQIDDTVYLIDQHAAHERILFDRFSQSYNQGQIAVQHLLVPYIINLNSEEFVSLSDHLAQLQKMGFGIEEFGDLTYKISAVPADFINIDAEVFISQILSDTSKHRSYDSMDFIRDKLIGKACKAAVKAGDTLDKSQIENILTHIIQGNTVLLCPHGRPIVVSISKHDMEKMFKRVV